MITMQNLMKLFAILCDAMTQSLEPRNMTPLPSPVGTVPYTALKNVCLHF